MKRTVVILATLAITALLLASVDDRPPIDTTLIGETVIGTQSSPYIVVRTVTSNDTALSDDEKDWTSIKALIGTDMGIPRFWSNLSVAFYGYGDGTAEGDPNTGTFDAKIFMVRYGGSFKTVWSGTSLAVGDVEMSHNPQTLAAFRTSEIHDPNYCWVDTIPAGTDVWPTTVGVSGGGGAETASNIAELWFDPLGYWGIYIEITNMTNVTSVTYVISGCGG